MTHSDVVVVVGGGVEEVEYEVTPVIRADEWSDMVAI
jgi:hypothetical protein